MGVQHSALLMKSVMGYAVAAIAAYAIWFGVSKLMDALKDNKSLEIIVLKDNKLKTSEEVAKDLDTLKDLDLHG